MPLLRASRYVSLSNVNSPPAMRLAKRPATAPMYVLPASSSTEARSVPFSVTSRGSELADDGTLTETKLAPYVSTSAVMAPLSRWIL